MSENAKNQRQLTGKVVSDKMDKTVVVAIERRVPHPVYGKMVTKTTRLKAHDEANSAKVGDTVRIVETRPLSKDKRWRLLEIVEREKPWGVLIQYGGQTPLRLAQSLKAAGVPIIGTSPDSIDRAEDRERFDEVLTKLDLLRPANGIARSQAEAIAIANRDRKSVV